MKKKIIKGIILAGGKGTRFSPFTDFTSKHLLPIIDKPIIFYPIANFLKNGINEILIISDKKFLNDYKKLLAFGKKFGIKFHYKVQSKPNGLPEALILGKNFVKNDPFALNLGDHILFGTNVDKKLKKCFSNYKNNTIFTYKTKNTKEAGVLVKDLNRNHFIVEKPKKTISNKVITGIYIYNKEAIEIAHKLKKSKRNELEITDLNNRLIKFKKLIIENFDKKKNYWSDAGDSEKVFNITNVVKKYEKKNNMQIANLHEIAFLKGLVKKKFFQNYISNKNSQYFIYLKKKYENN